MVDEPACELSLQRTQPFVALTGVVVQAVEQGLLQGCVANPLFFQVGLGFEPIRRWILSDQHLEQNRTNGPSVVVLARCLRASVRGTIERITAGAPPEHEHRPRTPRRLHDHRARVHAAMVRSGLMRNGQRVSESERGADCVHDFFLADPLEPLREGFALDVFGDDERPTGHLFDRFDLDEMSMRYLAQRLHRGFVILVDR